MIPSTIPKNPHFNLAEENVRSICNSLLNPVGITYFNYLRFYNDGSCYLVTTHGKVIEYVFEHHIPVAAPISEKYVKKNFNYFILPMGNYEKYVHYIKNEFNLAYLIDLVDRHNNYMELFCFGSTADNPEIINYYLSNMDFLERFKLYFKDKATDLLDHCEKNKILLPEIMYPPYKGFQESKNNKNFKLTTRQYECLSQISIGRTAKEDREKDGNFLSHR